MSRMPWAQRPMRGLPAARECALAAEQILEQVVADPNLLDRILNMIEVSINQHLRQMTGEAQNAGFDPVSGAPSRSKLEYTHRARSAQELRDTAHLVPGPVQPPSEPTAPAPRARPRPQLQPRQPNANPNRPNPSSMPWV